MFAGVFIGRSEEYLDWAESLNSKHTTEMHRYEKLSLCKIMWLMHLKF